MKPITNGIIKLISEGKNPVIFNLKKEFKNTSKILIKNKKEPKYKKVFKFSLLGLKKLIFDIYFSLIAIFLLYQFINIEIEMLRLKYVSMVIETISIALPVCINAVPANTKTKSG